jgi:DNA-binding MarR family transcriptional regulator
MNKAKDMPALTSQTPDIENMLNGLGDVMSNLLIDNHQAYFAGSDLTLLQAQVLRVLRRGSLATGKLASELRISASAVTQLTDRLIRKELIERQSKTGDRRSILVGLSAKGKRLVDGFRKRRTRLFAEALGLLDKKEQAQVLDGIKLLITAVKSYRESNDDRDALSTQIN